MNIILKKYYNTILHIDIFYNFYTHNFIALLDIYVK